MATLESEQQFTSCLYSERWDKARATLTLFSPPFPSMSTYRYDKILNSGQELLKENAWAKKKKALSKCSFYFQYQ